MNALGDLGRALAVERIKIRRTPGLWLVAVLPAAPAFLHVLVTLNAGTPPARGMPDPWLIYGQSVLVMWAVILLPLFVALETGLLAGVEHQSGGFKHLFALPVRRGVVYTAKELRILKRGTKEQLKTVHRLKREFDGEVVD